jgi:hypothetical protein
MSQNVGRAVPGQGYVRVTVRPTLLAGQKCPKLVRVQETKLDERAPCSYGGPTTGSVALRNRESLLHAGMAAVATDKASCRARRTSPSRQHSPAALHI